MNNCAMLDMEYSKSIQEPKRSTETIDFTIDDLTSLSPIPNLGLSGIVERISYKPRNGIPYMLFFCEAEKRYNGGCPFCGSLGYHVHGKLRDDKLIHDVPRGVIQVDIRLELETHLLGEKKTHTSTKDERNVLSILTHTKFWIAGSQ